MVNNKWKTAIEQSLKGRTFEETFVAWAENNRIAPVFDQPDKQFRFNRSQSSLIGTRLKTSMGASSIIKALELGCNAPSILLDTANWEIVLKGVFWEMIEPILVPTSLSQITKVKNYLSDYEKEVQCTLSQQGLNAVEQNDYNQVITNEWPTLFSEYIYLQFNVEDDIPERIAKFLLAINNYQGVSSQIVLNWQIGEHIINELAALRALQACIKIWRNSIHNTPVIRVDAHVSQATTNDSYRGIMQLTSGALIAKSGGAWRLLLNPVEKTDRLNNSTAERLAFNIQHLLNEEGSLDHIDDPAAGSFLIEQLTFKMAQSGWDKFCSTC